MILDEEPTIITEAALDEFRGGPFSTDAILGHLVRHPAVLLNAAPGVGKSHRIDDLLDHREIFRCFHLVIYMSPSWNIINERLARWQQGHGTGPDAASGARRRSVQTILVKALVLRPRPSARCGALDLAWRELESAGCGALGKATLCAKCPNLPGCDWPERLSESNLAGVRMVFMTEQQLVINRGLIRLLKQRIGADRVLVIADEARLVDTSFVVASTRPELVAFANALAYTAGLPADVGAAWSASIEKILAGELTGLKFPRALLRHAAEVQAAGLALADTNFRFIAHELLGLRRARTGDRWVDRRGTLHFEIRPDLAGAKLLVASAYMEASYLAHRLDLPEVAAPLAGVKIGHTGTRLFNLRMRSGMAAYYMKNSPQLLDFHAALIARNIAEGRTTVVVVRKRFVTACVKGLQERLGASVRFAPAPYDDLGLPAPRTIPVVTYGAMGFNDLAGYECCICLTGFYVSLEALDAALQGAVAPRWRIPLSINVGTDGARRVRCDDAGFRNDSYLALADACLRKAELEPALQAAARVRFNVKPREVWFFAMHDVARAAGMPVRDLSTLADAYQAVGLVRPRVAARAARVAELRALMDDGLSLRKAAAALGIPRQTASRWLAAACPTSPIGDLQEETWDND